MNTLASIIMTDPYEKVSECIQFTIDDVSDPFVLNDIMTIGRQYTFSLWLMSELDASLSVSGATFAATNAWNKYFVTFTANGTDLLLNFDTAGTYYIYHPQLEIGNKVTDWTPAPEDMATEEDVNIAQSTADAAQEAADGATERATVVESTIRQLADSIAMLVTDANGASLMTQTEDGWTFCTAAIQEAVDATAQGLDELTESLGSVETAVSVLDSAVQDLGEIAEYIAIGSYTYTDEDGVEQTVPSIDLGETDSNFKLKITNRIIMFTDGDEILVYIDSEEKSLNIGKAVIENELQIGGIVIKKRANGNVGFTWKGVSS